MGSEGLHKQKRAGLGLRSELTFPLVAGGHRRGADRLAELRDRSIGSFALGDPLGPKLGGFRGREARHRYGLLKRVGIEIKTHLEPTRKRTLRLETTN